MPQIELNEGDLEKVDRLVKEGLFSNRDQAIQIGLENLLQLTKEEIENMNKAKHETSIFLEIHMGDILYPGTPLKVVIGGEEMYKVPVKTLADINKHFFYLYVDPHTMEVNVNLLTDLRSLPELSHEELEETKRVQTEANNYCKNNFNMLVAGIPLKDALEVEEGFKECFRVPLIDVYEDKAQIRGYLFLDAKRLTVLDCTIFDKYKLNL